MTISISPETSSLDSQGIARWTEERYEVVVAGGGLSGVCAAIAAAREGAKVVLIQDRPVLGGNASSEVRMHVVGANTKRPAEDLVLEPRESGIIEEIRLENAYRNAQRSPCMFDLILYEFCLKEPNLTLFLNTRVIAAEVQENKIRKIKAVRASTEDGFWFEGSIFIDCTGDGGLGEAAGADSHWGREGQAEFGESLAQPEPDKETLGSTLLFMARRHDKPMPFIAPEWARKFTKEELHLRIRPRQDQEFPLEYGFWWLEWGGQLDTIKDDEKIRHELLRILMGVWDHVKSTPEYQAENWALDWIASIPGKRESRRFLGHHILTESDVIKAPPHPHAIAYGGWPIDLHPPSGVDAVTELPCIQHPVPYIFPIPLECCVSRNIENLLFAGRNLSATHVAFASTRVMATCALVGQGTGTAAAVAIQKNFSPTALLKDSEGMKDVQQRLLKSDAFLIGEKLSSEKNLAASAEILASSSQEDAGPEWVLSGVNRTVTGDRGVNPEQCQPGPHRWMSDPKAGLPAWLQFRWENPIQAKEIVLTFDTGLHRHLTLTQSDAYSSQMIWGTGQLELVRHYQLIAVNENQEEEVLCEVKDNWQRQRRHDLPTKPISELRLEILSTWGLDHARVIEVRVE